MKVALVWPEVLDMARYRELRKEFPPFGVLYLASVLEQHDIEVVLYKLTPTSLSFDFSEFDAVGFSVSASATFNMFMECRDKSQFAPDTLFMVGGVHATLLPEQTLIDLRPDVVGIGEGEETILDLLDKKLSKDFSNVLGVCYLGQNGAPVRTPPRPLNRDISQFPYPARHLLQESDFIMSDRMSNTNTRMTHIVPGRGCPFPCRFCASAQTTVQLRTGADFRRELEYLVDQYQIAGFAIVGNDFILSPKNVHDICDHIADLDLSWATLTRVDRVDYGTLAKMKKAGCYEIEFGVESGSQRMLDAMDKRATVVQATDALAASAECGIKNKVFLVHGFPGENSRSTDETIRFLDRVDRHIERVSLFRWVPLPGTYAFNHAGEYGIRGTLDDPGWDGDWGKFHIHHNHHHWWGSSRAFAELTREYEKLKQYVESRWPSRFSHQEIPEDQWHTQSKRYSSSLGGSFYTVKHVPAGERKAVPTKLVRSRTSISGNSPETSRRG